jgi:hypothetical protein
MGLLSHLSHLNLLLYNSAWSRHPKNKPPPQKAMWSTILLISRTNSAEHFAKDHITELIGS